VTAVYTPREDGRLTVTNRCREAGGSTTEAVGLARRVEGRPPSVLEVRFAPAFLSFLPAVWGDGTPDRKFLWVLARTPRLDPGVYRTLLDGAKAQGFDVASVVLTPQSGS
jgi:apolipoprotein D and lipocalin family protein